MRMFLAPLVITGAFLAFLNPVRADEQARAIIDKAIAANGGEEVLAKNKAGTFKSKGTLEILGGAAFTQEVVYSLPDKFKESMELEIMGQKIAVVTICNGDKVAIKANGMSVPLEDKIKDAIKEAGHAMTVARLIGLKDKSFTLSLLGDAKVEGKDAVGVKVTTKGQKDIDMYFDKQTHLMVKLERKAIDTQSGNEVTEERIITEYAKGAKGPEVKKMLIKQDGKKFMELEVLEIKQLETIDENVFTIE